MTLDGYSFTTPRLAVAPWRTILDRQQMIVTVKRVMTPSVTAALPDAWRGSFDTARAAAWLDEVESESTLLLVCTDSPVGMVVLAEIGEPPTDLRLGFMLAESAWGHGLGVELVEGIARHAALGDAGSITGGVDPGNVASVRTLERAGFVRRPDSDEFRLDLHAS